MLEFLVSAFFPLAVLVLVAALYSVRSAEADGIQTAEEMGAMCQRVAAGMEGVYFGGPGTRMTLQLPERVAGETYNITIAGNESTVAIRRNDTLSGCKVRAYPLRHANGSTVFRVWGNITFSNEEGTVVVS